MSRKRKKHHPKREPVTTGYGGGWIGYGFPGYSGDSCQPPLNQDQFSSGTDSSVASEGNTGASI